ncbi:hypothetical protein [Vulcanisaeta souniana]|uniref:Uncharacterized protein n=1 Tax=Vulcanisaeta souniana JCM 11219 TaxID=1293586 RepID=A0A830E0F2_9CREN|nr:hypothetical protein [Vulcanisaeta souniana]BDR91804.1 hypothetical protein Vsou_08970 [Vulcanisaeta souniana JCM 11219]GGI70230.1 hypothetical protein GCM10007112_04020 [Vulcanisaeta souniana JCM 11219]
MPGKVLVVGVVVAVVVIAIALILLMHPFASKPSVAYLTVNAPYAFLRPLGSGQYELFYYDQQGNLHDLGTYNVSSTVLNEAVNEINSFNQQNAGTIINGQNFIPLSYEVVIGNSTGVVKIPIQGNTILLDKVNPGYWTVLVTDQNDLTKLAYALDVGYKEAATVSGTSNLWYQQGVGTILTETFDLGKYALNPSFAGANLIITNNGTFIPFAYMLGTNQNSYSYQLTFVEQSDTNVYS